MSKAVTQRVIAAVQESWDEVSTYPSTDEEIVVCVNKMYVSIGQNVPRVVVAASPLELAAVSAVLGRLEAARPGVKSLYEIRLNKLRGWLKRLRPHTDTVKQVREHVDELLLRVAIGLDDSLIDTVINALQYLLREGVGAVFIQAVDNIFDSTFDRLHSQLRCEAVSLVFEDSPAASRPYKAYVKSELRKDRRLLIDLLRVLQELDVSEQDLLRLVDVACDIDLCQTYAQDVKEYICRNVQPLLQHSEIYFGLIWRHAALRFKALQFAGAEIPEQVLDPFLEWTKHCSIWSAYAGLAIVCRNPVAVFRQDGKLHNDSGPAIRWADGYSIWAKHGEITDAYIPCRRLLIAQS